MRIRLTPTAADDLKHIKDHLQSIIPKGWHINTRPVSCIVAFSVALPPAGLFLAGSASLRHSFLRALLLLRGGLRRKEEDS